ncbi:MAG: PEGA domain-containing protein [Methanomicrobiaceae archaeon]|nr:PEGA domain-containing protein [Methanomicrobiaceae archaeon]
MVCEGMRGVAIVAAVIFMVFAAVCAAGCDDDDYTVNSYPNEYSSSGHSGSTYSSGPGYLSIWTSPAGASVYVDGQYRGETSAYDDFILEGPGGTYKVEIYKAGYDAYQEYVTIYPGETRQVNAYLQQTGYDPYYTPAPTYDPPWTWEPQPTGDGPIFEAATRPIY